MSAIFRRLIHIRELQPLPRLLSYYYSPPKKRNIDSEFVSEARLAIQMLLKEAAKFDTEQWQELTEKLLSREIKVPHVFINSNNIDGVILRLCSEYQLFDTGKKYFDLIKKKNNHLSDVLLSRYLDICALNKNFCIENKDEIISIYRHLRKNLMEPHIVERCISAICMYEDVWKESLELLDIVKKNSDPTSGSFCSIIEAAFTFGNADKGWELLGSLSSRITAGDFRPRPSVYLAYIEHCRSLKSSGSLTWEDIEKLFRYLDEYSLAIPNETVANDLGNLIASLSDAEFKFKCQLSIVPRTGVCSACRKMLDPVEITDMEFEELRKEFIKKAVVGSNIFLKTTPAEINRYKSFLAKSLPYDIVIDGLNVAYSRKCKDHRVMAQTLASVVAYFVDKKLKVLVLGRQHMRLWPAKFMDYIFNNAKVFFAQNLSEDDPFLLYATLKGGKSTCLVSKDLMRSHAFLLEDPKLKRLFKNWLLSHQYSLQHIDKNYVPNITTPLPYCPTAQKLTLDEPELSWHLPVYDYNESSPTEKADFTTKWLCIWKKVNK